MWTNGSNMSNYIGSEPGTDVGAERLDEVDDDAEDED
jgi:hypothetical protein